MSEFLSVSTGMYTIVRSAVPLGPDTCTCNNILMEYFFGDGRLCMRCAKGKGTIQPPMSVLGKKTLTL